MTLLLLAAGCSRAEEFVPPQDPMVGKAAPPFVFHSVHQRSFPSSNFAGKTVVMIFVRAGQPEAQWLLNEMEALHREPSFSAVQFLVIAPEEDPVTKPFWVGLDNPLPLALDFTDVSGRYGAGALPLVVIRDFHDVVRLRLDGYVGPAFYPRLSATRRILKEVEEERTRPSSTTP
jgi:hypothetical protein